MGVIYRYEATGIQKWILATDRLKEIKGASAIVEGLTSILEQGLRDQGAGAQLLVGAAGGATVRFPDRQSAIDFRAHWPMIVSQKAPGLALAQAIVDESIGDTLFQELANELRADRARHQIELPESGPCIARAPRTGLPSLPAVGLRKGESLEDPASHVRRIAGEEEQDALAERVWRTAQVQIPPRFPDSLDDMGRLAVVVADGNDLGQKIRDLSGALTPDSYQQLSDFISSVTCRALVEATSSVYGSDEAMMRPVIVGGDDVCVLLRAQDAWSFVCAFLKAFEKESAHSNSPFNGPLTASAGIAFVSGHHPFHLAFDLAQDLCKSAKKKTRGIADGVTPSGILYHRVTTALSGGYDQIVERELTSRSGAAEQLSQGPYLLNDISGCSSIDQLEELIEALSDCPKGSIREVLDSIHVSRGVSRNRFERLQQVLHENRGGAEKLARLRNAFQALDCDEFGWQLHDGVARTPLGDAQMLASEIKIKTKEGAR
ncbi:hypothetical protein OAN47_03245 [Planctomycetota bacterium]|nr:hypothetical protein [Planctomycetota bacterium]